MPDALKHALRQHHRAARQAFAAGLTPANRDALEAALAALAAPLLAGCHYPASYAAMPEEISPRGITGTFALPRIGADGLSFHICPVADLVPGHAGILQPPATAPRVTPDLLLVPLVAVTPAGDRLGQGKGYYDRFLEANPGVRTIALAWDIQVADTLPSDPWDIAVDFVATPTRLFDCARLR